MRRWTIAILAAVSFLVLGLILYAWGGQLLLEILRSTTSLNSRSRFPLVVGYEDVARCLQLLYPATCFFVALAAFASTDHREGMRLALYMILLLVIGPLTFINYRLRDQWLNVGVQALLNLFIIFVALTLVLVLRRQKAMTADSRALQIIAILLLTSIGIALPMFYTAIFLGVILGLLDHEQVQQINDQVPLIFTAGVGVFGTFLSQLESLGHSAKRADLSG